MINMTITIPTICFIDFLYPSACFENRWAIVDILANAVQKYTDILPEFICIPSDKIFNKDIDFANSGTQILENCIAFLGVETSSNTQLANADMFVVGPPYNYSRDLVIPYQTDNSMINGSAGWKFVSPLDWVVWVMLILVVIVAVVIQVLMKKMQVDASPTLDKETGAEIVSRSILSTAGYSRLYAGNSHIISRHLLSCCMSCFSFFIVSLYCSNLVNFFYTANEDYFVLPQLSVVRVHPAFQDILPPDTFPIYTDGNLMNKLQTINMVPYGIYDGNMIPVVSRVIGDSFRNSTTELMSLGSYKAIYYSIFTKLFKAIYGRSVLKNIIIEINMQLELYQLNKSRLLDYNDTPDKVTHIIGIEQVWGAFVILSVGYVTSILFRIFFTSKSGLSNITLFKHPPTHEKTYGCGSNVPTNAPNSNVAHETARVETTRNDMVEIELIESRNSTSIV